jgi:hypothetical protein
VCIDSDARQVNGSEAEVSASGYNFTGLVVVVCNYAGTASHVSGFGFGSAFLVELCIEGHIEEGEVGEQTLCGYLAGELERIEELEQERLPYGGVEGSIRYLNYFGHIVSASRIAPKA